MKRFLWLAAALSPLCAPQIKAEALLEEVVVTAALQQQDAQRVSVSVLSKEQIANRSAQHLEDLLSAAPNVNSAAGASRGRFFQIRGIGERSQFVEPVNASIAMLLDGIDLTGIGAAATTWDLQQIEILRGPQGTLLGANALAGLINLSSTPADSEAPVKLSAGLENYGGRRLGFSGGGQINGEWHARLAVQQYNADGFIDNRFLGRADTNERDELTGRLGMVWQRDQQRVDIGLYRIDVDNGYDAFSLDNTRQTLSDQPGRDASQTDAARIRWQRQGSINMMAQLSAADTDSMYSYDEDWSFVGIAPGWEYSSFDRYDRDRQMRSLEVRADASSTTLSWVTGLYLRREDEQLERDYTYLAAPFSSDLNIETTAMFGQVDVQLTDTITAFGGLRIEQRDSDYRDSEAVTSTLSDRLWSGRIGADWQLNNEHSLYLSLSRGVRSGGFNASLLASIEALPAASQAAFAPLGRFDAESLRNTELGWRWNSADRRLSSDLTLFTMARRDQQVRRSATAIRPDGSTAFIDYTDNAARGNNRGAEWQLSWLARPNIMVKGALGLLSADYDRYVTALGENLSGRDQPQAPSYTAQLAFDWQVTERLNAGLEWTAMDSYFFSDRHDTRSPSRRLINAHLGWQHGDWSVRLWGRNLLDEDTFVRGFGSFGNDPRKEYALEPYYQYGEPRVVGATLELVL